MTCGQLVPSGSSGLARLIYRSRSTLSQGGREAVELLRLLVEKARLNNETNNLTGILLFDGKVFLQVLEGPLALVERTYERIACDQRHTEIEVIDLSMVEERDFGSWSMAMVDVAAEQFPSLIPFMVGGTETHMEDMNRVIAEVCESALELA